MSKARLGPFFAVFSVGLVACGGSSPASLCDAAFDCGSLSKTQYDNCVADGERLQNEAEKAGCDAEFQAAVDCGVDEGICKNGEYTAYSCDKDWNAFEACAETNQ